jgi:hypothetical protein
MKLVVDPTKEAGDDLRVRVLPKELFKSFAERSSSLKLFVVFHRGKLSIESPSSNSINDQSIFASLPNVISNPNQRSTQLLMHQPNFS